MGVFWAYSALILSPNEYLACLCAAANPYVCVISRVYVCYGPAYRLILLMRPLNNKIILHH